MAEGQVGAYLWGWDPINRIDRRVRVLPDGSLSLSASIVVDDGVATGGTATTLDDTRKNWGVDIQEGATLEVTHAGIRYQRMITSNAATQLVFDTMGVAVVAGDVYKILKAVDPMTPISKGVLHNSAYVAAADFFGAALAPTVQPTLFRCQGAFSVAGILSVTITRGGNTQVVNFNRGINLDVDCLFMFDTLVQDGTTINYRYSVNCTIRTFSVLEIPAAI